MAKKPLVLPPVSGKKTNEIPRVGGGTLRTRPRLGGELPPVSGKKTNEIPRVGGGGGGVLRTRTPRPPRASSTSMKGGGGVQGMSKPRPYSTSMGGAGTSVQAVSGPRAKPRTPRAMTAAMLMSKPKRGK